LQCGYYEGLQKQDIVDKHLWNTVDATIKSESAYPRIPIRNSWNDPIILLDDGGAEIGTLEYERAYRELHPGAIHRTATSNYKVKKLVLKERTAHLKEIEDVEYYTNPDVETVIDIGANPVEEILSYGKYPLLIGRGELEVNLSVGGYWRIYQNGGFPRRSKLKNNSERKFKTKGFWLTIPPKKAMLWNSIIPEFSEKHSFNIFHSIEHLLIREIAEMGYCDASDVISLTYADHYNYRNPIIFIYDNYHKGLGISDRISINIDDLIRRAYSRLVNCKCYDGCPVCIIKNSFCEHREDFTDKARAVLFLNSMTGKQPKRKKYISRNDSLKQFTTYGGDYFKVGDEYAHGWKVIEKSDDEYILENGAGDIAYVPYEDSPL
jgi:DEAD/DEAH box helicase domain-containing protein